MMLKPVSASALVAFLGRQRDLMLWSLELISP